MKEDAAKFIDHLASICPATDGASVVDKLYELTDIGSQLEDPTAVFPAVFEFLETNDGAELGEPGPLVHFLEASFPGGYEGLLVRSLDRSPTRYTVWMANRLLNSNEITLFLRSRLFDALQMIAADDSHSDAIREQASEYLKFQESKGHP